MRLRLLLALALLIPLAAPGAPARPPNLIWIMADDLGYAPLPTNVAALVQQRVKTLKAAGRPIA